MSDDILIALLIVVVGVIALILLMLKHVERIGRAYERANADIMDRWLSEREAWTSERQQLLDRIQAPSFGELKQAEVKTIKAQQGVKDPVPLEPV